MTHVWAWPLCVLVGGFLLLLLVALLVFRAALVCCRAGLLVVPVGGGPPASRPRSELRSARRLEARPGPAAAHGHRSQALLPPTSTAAWPCRRPRAPQPGPPVPPAPSMPAVMGVWQH